MKKVSILAILVFSAVIFTECYDDSKNATVRINLGNVPIAKQIEKKSLIDKVFSIFVKDAYAQQTVYDNMNIQVVHFGIYSEGMLIARESINGSDIAVDGSNSYVELSVPAGNSRTILALGEFNSDGTLLARYFGSNTVNLTAGTTTDVTISMNSSIGFNYDYNKNILSWDYQGGRVKYIVKESNEEIIYSGYGKSIPANDCTYYNIYMTFEDFDLEAENDTSTGQTYCP